MLPVTSNPEAIERRMEKNINFCLRQAKTSKKV
jgi:hypothetical protein